MQNIAHPSGLKEPCIVLISDPEDKQEKIEVLFSKIIYSCNDFIIRAGKPDGKNNRQLVKAYYRKLGQDLLNDVLEISKDLEDIAQ